jgi:hypothetical protein
LEIDPEHAEMKTSLGLPYDELLGGRHFSAVTGGVIDLRRGHDGNPPDDDYILKALYSELIGKS